MGLKGFSMGQPRPAGPGCRPRGFGDIVEGLRLRSDASALRRALERHQADGHDRTSCRACRDLERKLARG